MPFTRLTKDKPRLGDTLEVIKYLCKDFWTFVFGKQIDNLRTNHRASDRNVSIVLSLLRGASGSIASNATIFDETPALWITMLAVPPRLFHEIVFQPPP